LEIPLLRIKASSLTVTLADHLIYQATLTSAEENRYFTKISDAFYLLRLLKPFNKKTLLAKLIILG